MIRTITIATAALLPLSAIAQVGKENVSLKQEVRAAIDRGIKSLVKAQDPETGAWGDTDVPALTGLATTAIVGAEKILGDKAHAKNAEKGFAFIASKAKDDGGIYGKGLACYNTALCLTALSSTGDKKYQQLMLDARRFLINQQSDFDVRGESDNKYDGGIGYGGTYAHSDLSNTHFVLEALYYSESLFADTGINKNEQTDLDWAAAIKFVERCQNLPKTNDQKFASDDPANKGGFVYFPGDSKAGEQKLKNGKVALRSYGSMSYAGLLSLVYAKVDQSDERIQAVLKWLSENYAIDENPGMGAEGLFYYYHTMAKALAICNVDKLKLKDGTEVNWREDLAKKMFNLQSADGSWTNENGRWWEKDPVLVTSYAVLTLEHLYSGL